jgi:hypothetical protein
VPERIGDRGVLQAAVHLSQRTVGFFDHGACRAIGFLLELDAEHAAGRPVRPVDHAATGFQQRLDDATAG